jgi:hypothetical protein
MFYFFSQAFQDHWPQGKFRPITASLWLMPDASGVLDMWGDGARGARRQLVCAKAGIMHVKIAS